MVQDHELRVLINGHTFCSDVGQYPKPFPLWFCDVVIVSAIQSCETDMMALDNIRSLFHYGFAMWS